MENIVFNEVDNKSCFPIILNKINDLNEFGKAYVLLYNKIY